MQLMAYPSGVGGPAAASLYVYGPAECPPEMTQPNMSPNWVETESDMGQTSAEVTYVAT